VSHPAVDVVTERVAVVLQDRPVVPFTAWLADAVRVCADADRGLQVVTPTHTRLTTPLRLALDGPDTRWVVRDRTGATCYDGLSGRLLHWDGSAFAPTARAGKGAAPALAAEFLQPDTPTDRQLVLDVRVRHAATATATLGGTVAEMCSALTGQPPRGWGAAEPATQPWEPEELTALARRRAPRPTWLVVVGGGDRPAVGTLQVARAASGVDEALKLVVGCAGEVPLPALAGAAEAVAARHALVSMLAQVRPGRADTTWEPRLSGPPVPVAMAVGHEGIRRRGLEHALAAPVPQARRIGEQNRPGVWFGLGDGGSGSGWEHLAEVLRHLGAP
jgi:hypothetical protein